MNKKIKAILLSIFSFLSGSLGLVGLSGWCCTLAGAAVLSLLGLASFSIFLVSYNKLLLFVSIIFLVSAIISFVKYKKAQSCLK